MSLLTLKQLRERRDMLTEQELLRTCQSAARLILRGKVYSPDDRADCAATIMADGLRDCVAGSLPNKNDDAHCLTAYMKRAQNFRRSIDRQRIRDEQSIIEAQDYMAQSMDLTMLLPNVDDIEETSELAAKDAARMLTRRLMAGADSQNVETMLYGYVRDLPGPVVAQELEIEANAYDVRILRAKKAIRELYPDPADLLDVLTGTKSAKWVHDDIMDTMVLSYCLTDDSQEAHNRTHILAQDWRDGTDDGKWPTKPENIDDARSRCETRMRRPQNVAARERRDKAHRQSSPEQIQADALRRLGWALSR